MVYTAVKAPISYYGGKYYHRERIVNLIPYDHRVFVEVFGGAGWVIFAKAPSWLDVWNDKNRDLFTFFKVLREREEELIGLLEKTPYCQNEYEFCVQNPLPHEPDEVEQARRYFVRLTFSYGGKLDNGLSITAVNGRYSPKHRGLINYTERLREAAYRLRQIETRNKDFREIMGVYDDPETVMLLDPPYETGGDGYQTTMSTQDHHDLINILPSMKCRWLLTAYDEGIYSSLNGRYHRIELDDRNGFEVSEDRENLPHVLWCNFDPGEYEDSQMRLF